jgi:hypothetical protein
MPISSAGYKPAVSIGGTYEFQAAEDMLLDARVKWHTFDLDTVRKQADGAFIKGTKVKDGMLKRLGAE